MLSLLVAGALLLSSATLDMTPCELPIEAPQVVDPVEEPPPGLSDSWPTSRRDFSQAKRLGYDLYFTAPTVGFIACERDKDATTDTVLVKLGRRVGVFRTGEMFGFLRVTKLLAEIPLDVSSPYAELVAIGPRLDIPFSPDLASRLLNPRPSGSCGS